MPKLLILVLFITSTFSAYPQIIESRVNKYVTKGGIDTFLIYSFPCSGYISIDSCHYEESQYLIWKQHGNYYLKKFAYCETFKTISVDTANPLTYYLKNKTIIDREEIKQPTYFEVRKKRKTIDTLTVTSTVSHSCSHKFQSPLMSSPHYKYADTYDLSFKIFDDGTKNIYYEDNLKSKFNSLIDLTTALIKKLQTDNKFAID